MYMVQKAYLMSLPCFLLTTFFSFIFPRNYVPKWGSSSRNKGECKSWNGEKKTEEGEWLRTMHHSGKLLECCIRENKNYNFIRTRKDFCGPLNFLTILTFI